MSYSNIGEFAKSARVAQLLLRDLITSYSGIHYENDKLDILADKLSERIVALGLANFDAYYHYLRYDSRGNDEWGPLMDALTVKETYFMREVEQLRVCVDRVIPEIQDARHDPSTLIWSAACSTGEEPYSLAMLLRERGRTEGISIIGTDISDRALKHARGAVYRARSLRAMSPDLTARYLRTAPEGWLLDQQVRDMVSFRHLNLVDREEMRRVRGVDIIFCRNVFIYFSEDSVQTVLGYLHDALNPGGYLFVGTSESLLRQMTRFSLVEIDGVFAYRKS